MLLYGCFMLMIASLEAVQRPGYSFKVGGGLGAWGLGLGAWGLAARASTPRAWPLGLGGMGRRQGREGLRGAGW